MFKLETFWASENYLFGFKADDSKAISLGLGFRKKGEMCVRLLVLMIVMMSVCVGSAWGEDNSDPLNKFDENVSKQVYSQMSFGGDLGGKQADIASALTNMMSIFHDSLQEKGIQGSKIGNTAPNVVKPGGKVQEFHMPVLKNAFINMMRSKEWEKMYDDAVSGENSDGSSAQMIGAMTWGLANSAVGQARYNAIMQTQSALMNHYLTELTFLKQVEMNPYVSESVADAYFTCVRAKMSGSGTGTGMAEGYVNTDLLEVPASTGYSADKGGDKMSWFQAQEACMGDDSKTINKNSNEKERISSSIFTFKDSKDFNKTTGGDEGKKICLTDYIFNQEQNGDYKGENIAKLRQSYQKFLGDILFEIKGDGGIGLQTISYKFIFPKGKDSNSSGSSGGGDQECDMPESEDSPSSLLKKTIVHRYTLLMKTMKEYCEKVKGNGQNGNSGNDDTTGTELVEKFTDENQQFFEYFQLHGVSVDIQFIDNLYRIAEDYYGKIANNKMNCEEAFKEPQEDDIESYGKTDSIEESIFRTVYYSISRIVAESQIASAYFVLFNYLNNTTTASFGGESEIFKIALKHIDQSLANSMGRSLEQIEKINSEQAQNFARAKEMINEYAKNMKSISSDMTAGSPQTVEMK